MYNFDPCNVLLAIATNIPVLLMTAFVLQGHILEFLKVNWIYCMVLFCACAHIMMSTVNIDVLMGAGVL